MFGKFERFWIVFFTVVSLTLGSAVAAFAMVWAFDPLNPSQQSLVDDFVTVWNMGAASILIMLSILLRRP